MNEEQLENLCREWFRDNSWICIPTQSVTAIKLTIVGAGRARDGRAAAATLYYCAQMSRARPAPTVSLCLT